MGVLPTPPAPARGASPDDVAAWVAQHLGALTLEGADGVRPGGLRGGQLAADAALAALDVAFYSKRRSTVLPASRQGATRMSPYVRHGLVTLPELWRAVEDAPATDRRRYRDELLWQEYARHLYARVGSDLGRPLRREPPRPPAPSEQAAAGAPGRPVWADDPWPGEMACMAHATDELREHGWVVNQMRMWLASQWVVRAGADWRAGEQEMFAHLLDGSRAANRLNWQWTTGIGSTKPYGFSRWQVEKRAPRLCSSCALASACPIQGWPAATTGPPADGPSLGRAPIPGGPDYVEGDGGELVWLTAESLGTSDPALAADPDRPAVFVFDAPLLARLRLSGKRLVFLAETLGDLAERRELQVRLGDPVAELSTGLSTGRDGVPLAATHTPVPGWARRSARLNVVETHPWPWLVGPRAASVSSYTSWRRSSGH